MSEKDSKKIIITEEYTTKKKSSPAEEPKDKKGKLSEDEVVQSEAGQEDKSTGSQKERSTESEGPGSEESKDPDSPYVNPELEENDEDELGEDGEAQPGEDEKGQSEEGQSDESEEGQPKETEEGPDKKDEDHEDVGEKKSPEDRSDKRKSKDSKSRKNLNPDRSEGKKGKSSGDKKSIAKRVSSKAGQKKENIVDKAENIKGIALRAKAAIQNLINSLLGFLKVLINPITWIVIGVIVLFIFMVATAGVLGKNDYNILCDNSGIGSVVISPDADDFTRQSAIASWLTSTPFTIMGGQPLTEEQAAGIIGNMIEESYGANPRAIQGDTTTTQWENTSNIDVLGWGDVGGKAIGIIQWDGTRRINLVNFAASEGTQWYDLTTQLKFLKQEMDGDERQSLLEGGFEDKNKSIEEYAKIWNLKFERSGASGTEEGDMPRVRSAEAFAANYSGSIGVGKTTSCIGGLGSVDTSNLVQLAIESAWPKRSQALGTCVGLSNCGQAFSTDTYKAAKINAESTTSRDPINGLLASCDRFIATMYRATGQDPNFPWGDSSTQMRYMRDSDDWAEVSCQDRKPGDVLWREGHVMMYVGLVNGKDSIASASYKERAASLSGVSCQGDLFVGDGDTAIGFRKVN